MVYRLGIGRDVDCVDTLRVLDEAGDGREFEDDDWFLDIRIDLGCIDGRFGDSMYQALEES